MATRPQYTKEKMGPAAEQFAQRILDTKDLVHSKTVEQINYIVYQSQLIKQLAEAQAIDPEMRERFDFLAADLKLALEKWDEVMVYIYREAIRPL